MLYNNSYSFYSYKADLALKIDNKKRTTEEKFNDVVCELAKSVKSLLNLQTQDGFGRELGVPEPVVADHAGLVRVRNRTLFQLLHGTECGLEPGLHLRDELVSETDPAHVQVQPQILVLVQPVHVPPPQRTRVFLQQTLLRHLRNRVVGLRQLGRNLPSHGLRQGETQAPIGDPGASRECDRVSAERVQGFEEVRLGLDRWGRGANA